MEYAIELVAKLARNSFNNAKNQIESLGKAAKQNSTVNLDIETERATIKIAQLKRTISTLKEEMKDTDISSQAFKNYAIAIEDAENELKTLQGTLKETNDVGDNTGKNLDKNFKNLTKKASKFALSLFSIRTIWSLISRVSRTYINNSDEMVAKTKLLSNILGNTLAPIIKSVVNAAEYAFIFLYKLVGTFVNLPNIMDVANKSLKETSKSAKEASKSLASFDTISNLSTPTTDTSGVASGVNALKDFEDKVKDINKIFEDYGPAIKTATTLLGIFAGAKTIGKLANLIGKSGSANGSGASGLSGVYTWLALIAGAATIGITIKYIVEDYTEAMNALDNGIAKGDEIRTKGIKNNAELSKSIDNLKASGKDASKEIEELTNNIAQQSKDAQINNIAIGDSISLWEKKFGLSELTKQSYKLLSDQIWLNTQMLKKEYDQGELNEKQINDYKQTIENNIKTLENQNEHLSKNSDQYKINTQRINDLKTELDKIDGYKAEADVEVKADTKDFKDKISGILSTMGQSVLKTVLGFALPSSARITSWLNSFDVGTNYVPNDQLAMVHKGEMIVPKKYNPATSGIGTNNDDVVNAIINLQRALENKEFSATIGRDEIGEASIGYINEKSRVMGRSAV